MLAEQGMAEEEEAGRPAVAEVEREERKMADQRSCRQIAEGALLQSQDQRRNWRLDDALEGQANQGLE